MAAIDEQASRSLSNTAWRGVSVFWPEDDPLCGPGRYLLTSLSLAASLPSAASVVFAAALYTTTNGSWQQGTPVASASVTVAIMSTAQVCHIRIPTSTFAGVVALDYVRYLSFAHCGPLPLYLQYITVPLPSSFIADTLVSQAHLLSIFASSPVSWCDVAGGVSVPARGMGVPGASLMSSDGGASWVADATWPAVQLKGRKQACSPSPTPSPSRVTQIRTTSTALTPDVPTSTRAPSPKASSSMAVVQNVQVGLFAVPGSGATLVRDGCACVDQCLPRPAPHRSS